MTTCTNTGTTVVAATKCPFLLGAMRFRHLGAVTAHDLVTIQDGAGMLLDTFEVPYDATDTYLNYVWWVPPYPIRVTGGLIVTTTGANNVSTLAFKAEE